MSRSRIHRLVLSVLVCLVAVDALIVIGDVLREGGSDTRTLGNAVITTSLCALFWYGYTWVRWLLLGFIAWRVIYLGPAVVSSFEPGGVLRLGAFVVLVIYVFSAVVLALPVASSRGRDAT
jgi:hypothetical protein